MKDKKDLKSRTKSEHYLMLSAGVVGVITAIIFLLCSHVVSSTQ
jgi:hypothetical protein